MARETVLIVPATVPDARVTRVLPAAPERPTLVRAQPMPVPAATPVPVTPEQVSAEQVSQLREENEALRLELARARRD